MPDRPTPRTVLVVDDDPMIGELIAQVLALEGFEAFLVKDGREALQAAHDRHVDAITLDLDMPIVDGRGVLDGLRNDERTHDVPVVVVSANTQLLSKQDCAQVSRTLNKPFDLAELIQAVSSAVAHGLGGHAGLKASLG